MEEKLDKLMHWLKEWSITLLVTIIIIGILAVFICSFIFPHSVTVSMLNNFVGIILGVAATLMSIVSLVLSFYNVEQSEKSQRESQKNSYEINDALSKITQRIDDLATVLPDIKDRLASIETQTSSMASKPSEHVLTADKEEWVRNEWMDDRAPWEDDF